MNFRDKIINDNIEFLTKRLNDLEDWEKKFVDSIKLQHKNGKSLSRKQFNTLNDMHSRYKGVGF